MRAKRVARLLMVAALAVSSAACARIFGSYDVAPSGLDRGEEQLRSMLGAGHAAVVLDGFGTAYTAPDDDVLQALYEGILAYYAGDYSRSATVLDRAASAADDRVTKSISRSAMSLVSNDRVLPYEPGRTERLMLPYYAALARLRLGDYDGAAVEARRMSALLQQYRDDGAAVDPALAAALRYVAGAIFESNGNRVDADVAYRNALALDSSLVVAQAANGLGSVVVILEQGFVAHRVEQALAVMLLPEEVDAIAHGDGDEKVEAAGYVAGRIVRHASYASRDLYDRGPFHRGSLYVPAPDHSPLKRRRRVECTTVAQAAPDTAAVLQQVSNTAARTERHCEEKDEDDDDGLPYLLKVAWPVYRTDSRVLDARIVAGADTVAFFPAADVSRGVVADFEAERALVVARTIARGTAKLALTKGAEKKLEEKNEAAGRIIGLLGNIGNVLLERADTRSWHLLPAGISVVRLDLPAGEHDVHVEVGAGRTLNLGRITVHAGAVTVIPARSWQ